MCDDHPDRPAVSRVQGETDSMGCEMHDLCQECLDDMKTAEPMRGHCDYCKTPDQVLRPRRDYEEGLSGPVYYVCEPCIVKDNARINEELADEGNGDDWSWLDDGDDCEPPEPYDNISCVTCMDDPMQCQCNEEGEKEIVNPNVQYSKDAAEYLVQRRNEEMGR